MADVDVGNLLQGLVLPLVITLTVEDLQEELDLVGVVVLQA